MSPEYHAKMKLMGLEMSLEFTQSHKTLHEFCGIDPDKRRAVLLKEIEKQKKIVAKLNTGEYP